MTRLIFTAFLFLGVLVSVIMLSPGVESQLYKVSGPGTGRGGGQPVGPRPTAKALLLQAGGPGLEVPDNQEGWAGISWCARYPGLVMGAFLHMGRRV